MNNGYLILATRKLPTVDDLPTWQVAVGGLALAAGIFYLFTRSWWRVSVLKVGDLVEVAPFKQDYPTLGVVNAVDSRTADVSLDGRTSRPYTLSNLRKPLLSSSKTEAS